MEAGWGSQAGTPVAGLPLIMLFLPSGFSDLITPVGYDV
jgi:hypothetical protein